MIVTGRTGKLLYKFKISPRGTWFWHSFDEKIWTLTCIWYFVNYIAQNIIVFIAYVMHFVSICCFLVYAFLVCSKANWCTTAEKEKFLMRSIKLLEKCACSLRKPVLSLFKVHCIWETNWVGKKQWQWNISQSNSPFFSFQRNLSKQGFSLEICCVGGMRMVWLIKG